MKGLELSKKYFYEYGAPTIKAALPEAYDRLCFGLAGEGSECFGFDDELSKDHDFEPAFIIWITREDYQKFGFMLERIYEKLPHEFMGCPRQKISPSGGRRHGVIVIEDFYNKLLGALPPLSLEQWLFLPPHALACASNGEVFYDNLGEFSKIRNELLSGYPMDIILKKLSAHLIMMLQSGLYNYPRLLKRGEIGAAQLCVFEFVKHTISTIYLLNRKYEPFYKWAYAGLRRLERLSELEIPLVALTELANGELEAAAKLESIEEICALIIDEIKRQNLTDISDYDLNKHAQALQNKIKDINIRNMHIMEGI